jgi:large subunit ribosomal protein L29
MKTSEIRALSSEEMQQKLVDLKKELFNLRFQHEVGQLENPSNIKATQKDIARIYTISKEAARNTKENDN